MSSKQIQCLSLLLFVLLAACVKENETVVRPSPGAIITARIQCLDDALGTIEKVIHGVATENEVTEFWSCNQRGLQLFLEEIRGSEQGVYQATELKKFFEVFVLKNGKISDRLLSETMLLKQVILGGDTKKITRSEIEQIIRFMEQVKPLSLQLLPLTRTFSTGVSPNNLNISDYNNAEIKAVESVGLIADLLFQNQKSYDFEHMQSFVTALVELLQSRGTQVDQVDDIQKLVDILRSVKGIFLADTNAILQSDWRPLMQLAARSVGMFQRVKIYVASGSELSSSAFEQLITVANQALDILQASISGYHSQAIPYSSLDQLYFALEKNQLLPVKLKAKTLSRTTRKLFNQLVLIDSSDGLSQNVLNALRTQVSQLALLQKFSVDLQNDASAPQKPEYQNEVSKKYLRLIQSPVVLSAGQDGVIAIPNSLRRDSSYNLTAVSLVAMRMLFHGYDQDGIGLSLDQVKALFADYFPFANQIGFLDDDGADLWGSLWQEGDLFMPIANGDQLLQPEEAAEYVLVAESAKAASQKMVDLVALSCPNISPSNPIVNPVFDATCVQNELRDKANAYFVAIPRWSRFLNNQTSEDRLAILSNIIQTAVKSSPSSYTRSDLGKSYMLMQYVELMFAHFDLDQSSSIDLDESMNAFPLFRQALAKSSKQTDENALKAIFTYLLAYGEQPTPAQYLWWRYVSTWEFNADRARIVSIIVLLNHK